MQDNNFRNYVTADIHRHIQWTGWQLGQCHAYIWGTDYEEKIQQTLRTRLMDWALNRFLTNAFMLSEASMAAFAQKIREKQPKVLFGYVSAITRFAKFVQENQWNDIKFSGVISTAEILYPDQRKIIEDTFDCIVLNRYGTRELGGIACECPQQMGLHISAENVYIEILRDNEPVPKEEEGGIVVTALNNYAMPFIRYHTEDVGQLSETGCRCGRESPMIQVVLGRLTDLFKTKDGNTIHGEFFTHLFYGINEVKQFQVIQESYDHIAVHIVKRTSLPPEKMIYIEQAIKDIMKTDVRVSFRFLDTIPLQSSGKYRFTVSKVDQKSRL
jgi:phenylacetate-CoA ligase